MDSNIGKKLDGRYEITELIGVGGMADVYKAVDVMENRTVAVKILKPEFSQNEEFLRRFRNESKAIAVLSHPNIVKIYDVGFSDSLSLWSISTASPLKSLSSSRVCLGGKTLCTL